MKLFFHRNIFLMLISFSVYFFGFVVGFNSELHIELVEDITSITVGGYARNNLLVMISVLLGFFTLGLISLFILFTNGFILGAAILNAMKVKGTIHIILALLPHGVFEVFGLIIAGTVGLKSAQWCINKMLSKSNPTFLCELFIGILISTVFILTAALLEAKITPVLIN